MLLQAQFIEKPFSILVNREKAAALKHMLQQPLSNTGNYDVKFHRLSLKPSLTSRYLEGEVSTYFEPVQSLNQLVFDFNDQMSVISVTWHNQSVNFSLANNQLTINFPQTLPVHVLDSIQITYNGNVPNTGMDSYSVTTHNNVPIVWTLSEPYGAKDWWPCKQDLTDKADSITIKITYPDEINNENMIAVSNGLIYHDRTFADPSTGTIMRETTWKHHYPIAAYLVAFAVTNYTKFTNQAGIVQPFPIDNYVFPENLSQAQSDAVNFVPLMNYYEQTFGHYPFFHEKYGQIQFLWGGGMEHQTATFVINYSRPLVAHELAHQWFGDAVTCGSWHDIWLNEGFATYSEALTREHMDGIAAFDTWKQNAINYITSEPGGSVYVQDTTSIDRIFSSRLSYHKGAMVLNMLRLKLGDAPFFQTLKTYVADKSYGFAKTPDFRSEAENVSGQNLQEFFNDWVYGEGFPTYQINVTKTGTTQYEIVVHQTTSHPSVSFFEMPLPFVFSDDAGHTFDITLNNIQNDQHFTVDTGFEVTQVSFDPHHDIVKGTTTLNTALTIDNNVLKTFHIFPNPVKKKFYLKKANETVINKVSIYTLSGQLVRVFNNASAVYDIADLPSGFYLLEVKSPKGNQIIKLIKQ